MDQEAEFLKAVNLSDQTTILRFLETHDPTIVQDSSGCTALHIAAQNNSKHIFNLLVEHEKAVRPDSLAKWTNSKASDGRTCLHIAARQGNLVHFTQTIAESLIHIGADPFARTEGGITAIHFAAMGNHPALIAYLHEEANVPAASPDYEGNTPLHFAAHEGSELALTLLLIYAKEKIDEGNVHGDRPLHLAAASGQIRTTKLLLSQGADYTLKVPPYIGQEPIDSCSTSETILSRSDCNGTRTTRNP